MKSLKKVLLFPAALLFALTACKKEQEGKQLKPVEIVYTALQNWSAFAPMVKKVEVNLSSSDAEIISRAVGGIKLTLHSQSGKTISLPVALKADVESSVLVTHFYKLEQNKITLYHQINKENVIVGALPPKELRLNFFVMQ